MQKGVYADKAILSLMRERDWRIVDLAERTGISAGTLTAYTTKNPDARRRLGIENGRIIARAFDVELSRLGLVEEEAVVDDLTELRHAHGALEETVRLLTERVEALERKPGAPRRAAATRKRKAG